MKFKETSVMPIIFYLCVISITTYNSHQASDKIKTYLTSQW